MSGRTHRGHPAATVKRDHGGIGVAEEGTSEGGRELQEGRESNSPSQEKAQLCKGRARANPDLFPLTYGVSGELTPYPSPEWKVQSPHPRTFMGGFIKT